RIRKVGVAVARDIVDAVELAGHDARRDHPQACPEERDVYHRPATRALLAHEGGGDGAGEEGPGGQIAERRPDLGRELAGGHAGGMTDAGPGPEVGVVISAGGPFGPVVAVTRG